MLDLIRWSNLRLNRRKAIGVKLWCIATALALSETQAQQRSENIQWPKMSFIKAARPYLKELYQKDGFVDRQGSIKNGGLGCSAYVSVVLHRMRDGDEWLESYDLAVHQNYGDTIAKRFGMNVSVVVSAKTLADAAKVKSLIAHETLLPGALYMFNARRNEHGHVGFVRVKADGHLIQSHYSGLIGINGLATGEFHSWLAKSQYVASDVELYFVPEISQ